MDGIMLQSGGRFRKVEELCSKVGDVSSRFKNVKTGMQEGFLVRRSLQVEVI